VAQAREAEWAWDDALSTLRSIRSARLGGAGVSRSPMRSSPSRGESAASAQQRTSALLELLRARQAGGSVLNEQLRDARLRGCEEVMERWERMIYYRRAVRTLHACCCGWRQRVRRSRQVAEYTARRLRTMLCHTFLVYRSVAVVTAAKKRRLVRTRHLLDCDHQCMCRGVVPARPQTKAPRVRYGPADCFEGCADRFLICLWKRHTDARQSARLRCQRLFARGWKIQGAARWSFFVAFFLDALADICAEPRYIRTNAPASAHLRRVHMR
jgi:hypothetical protein